MPRPHLHIPTAAEDLALTAAAKADPDAQPWSAADLAATHPIKTPRGRPRSANSKRLVSIRYSPDVLAYFQSTGPGWQSKMDDVLLAYVRGQQSAA